jgi:CheY-like chemotaxis protein
MSQPSQKAVLVVEADDLIRSLAAEWLGAAGYLVITAAAAEDVAAVPALDAIVADLPAPRGGNVKAIRLLRELHPGVPIVATSACFMAGLANCTESAGRLGVTRCLEKPYTGEQLLASVRSTQPEPDGRTAETETRAAETEGQTGETAGVPTKRVAPA